MYKFIFYGVYRTIQHTVLSKGSEKETDVRISVTWLMAAMAGINVITLFYALLYISDNQLDLVHILFNKNNPRESIGVVILALILAAYNYFFCIKKLNFISEKYDSIYNKHEYLDRIVGFGYPIVSFVLFVVFPDIFR